jgi:hypothetical protein
MHGQSENEDGGVIEFKIYENFEQKSRDALCPSGDNASGWMSCET